MALLWFPSFNILIYTFFLINLRIILHSHPTLDLFGHLYLIYPSLLLTPPFLTFISQENTLHKKCKYLLHVLRVFAYFLYCIVYDLILPYFLLSFWKFLHIQIFFCSYKGRKMAEQVKVSSQYTRNCAF